MHERGNENRKRLRRREDANATVVGVILVVALTLVSAGSIFFAVSGFDAPEPDYPPFEDGESPFDVKYVEGTLTGDAVETALYDSTTGDVLEYGFDGSERSPPGVGGGITDTISDLQGSPAPQDGFVDRGIRISSGDYYSDDNINWWGWDGDGEVVFDTTQGPVRIAVQEGKRVFIDEVEIDVEGSHPVEFYLDRGGRSQAVFTVFDSSFDNHETDAIRVYARTGRGGGVVDNTIYFRNTDFRGVVYAPGTNVEFEDSTVHGASVADETVLDGSSYYHDTHLERLGVGVLPGVDADSTHRTGVLP